MIVDHKLVIYGADDMREFGFYFGKQLKKGDVIFLNGELGAGKTTLAQGIAKALEIKERILSPTFTIMREYDAILSSESSKQTHTKLVHIDVYRLLETNQNPSEIFNELEVTGLHSETANQITLVEWGRDLRHLVQAKRQFVVDISYFQGDLANAREIVISR
jgi:tRNA threonylcarbamoyl adenosine modification protein YjeE